MSDPITRAYNLGLEAAAKIADIFAKTELSQFQPQNEYVTKIIAAVTSNTGKRIGELIRDLKEPEEGKESDVV